MVSEWVDKTTEQLRAEGAVTTGGKTPAKKLSAADGCPDIHAPVEPVPDNDWVGIKMMIMIVSVFSSCIKCIHFFIGIGDCSFEVAWLQNFKLTHYNWPPFNVDVLIA